MLRPFQFYTWKIVFMPFSSGWMYPQKSWMQDLKFWRIICEIDLDMQMSFLNVKPWSYLPLNHESHWGTTDDFTNQFPPFFPVLHCPLGLGELRAYPFPDVFPSLPLSALTSGLPIPWCLPISSSICPVFFPLSLCFARWIWPDLMNRRHDHTTAVCVFLRSSGLRVVQLPAGSWHGLPRW